MQHTLKQLNAYIQVKYPLIEVVKGNGYFYVHSQDDEMALKLAGLYTTSISVTSVTRLSLYVWMQRVEYILRDEERMPSERAPII